MSEAVVLTLRAPLAARLDMAGVTPDRCAALSTADIEALPVSLGGAPATIGDIFDVCGERTLRLEIEGDLAHASGIGARMTSGVLHVLGNVGDDAGQAMSGGVLWVDGQAGDRLGAAAPGASKGMTGGEIVVFGSVGTGAGALMRRGLVAVAGGVGPFTGRSMIAGTLLALGPIAGEPGLGNKRGSIIAAAGTDIPATYRKACTYEPPHVRLLLTSLRRRFAFPASVDLLAGLFDRYCGDAGDVGKGEILVWTGHARESQA